MTRAPSRREVSVYPHLTAPAQLVEARGWLRAVTGSDTEEIIGSHISNWDSGTVLHLTRVVTIDMSVLEKKCALEREDRIALVAQWHSLRTSLRGTGPPVLVTRDGSSKELTLTVPAGLSGGMLLLRTFLILEQAAQGKRSRFAATRAGAILWQDRHAVALEGTGPRFPVEIRKFSGHFPSAAGWLLDWRPSAPDALFMGSVRLFLNEDHKAVVSAATSSNLDTSQKLIVSAIYADVARSLISGMLANDDFVNGLKYEKGTVGRLVGDLVAMAFPTEDWSVVRQRLEDEPELFAAQLQAAFKLFA